MSKVILAAQQPVNQLSFQLRYLIEGLISHSILQTEQVIPAIEQIYERFQQGKTLDVNRAAILLESLFFLERIDDIGAMFESEFNITTDIRGLSHFLDHRAQQALSQGFSRGVLWA
jgi:hypothetical protein